MKPKHEKTDDGKALRERAKAWLTRIEKAAATEKKWIDDAEVAVAVYANEDHAAPNIDVCGYDFNILHSNVETIVPAIINSPPAPDVRRRWGQDDDVARDYAELMERAMRVQVDDGFLQVEMEAMAQDAFLPGRGLIRLRFKSDFEPDEGGAASLRAAAEASEDASEKRRGGREDGEADPVPERVTGERVEFETVSWRDFRHGPAKRWRDVPWAAFRHSIPREDIEEFADAELVGKQAGEDEGDIWGEEDSDLVVWEIWVKKGRRVLFVVEGKDRIIKEVDDPLGLTRFFPIHDPVQPIEITGRLMPVNPFAIYRKLAKELDVTTKRIAAVTEQLKVKGGYSGSAEDLANLLAADTNDFVPIAEAEVWAQHGGLEKAVFFWPVDKLITVLRELYALREQTKQAIYEITGISDIVRGSSQARETATAQQIKTQWGSLRIQKMQRMMMRAARDIFVMMSEIIPTKFTPQTLERMTGIQLIPSQQDLTPVMPPQMPPPQPGMAPEQMQAMQQQAQQAAQQAQGAEKERQQKLARLEALNAMLKQPAANYYRIDVESDSTIKADLTRQKEEATGFMQAAGGYWGAVGPLVQQGVVPMPLAMEIFASFSRLFNLGKTVEDAVDELLKKAKEGGGQPPNPQADAAKMEAEAKAKAHEVDMQIKAQQMQHDKRMQELDFAGAQIDQKGKEADLAIKANNVKISGMDLSLKRAQLLNAATAGVPV